ncbi:alpha-L-fucosidase [Tichowtungia aerotolerans]|uniref:alpha-L-fucosidase n=1 Tax=Tichowtungia aerotolerans TaxID=2697043 RepID=A0A6P1MCI7_9BACT|nr:alpha-L-fucosidase [Tichowtungia aerotolerans]QHI69316.1 alpha-L-fucosidase [Tichowtungia aerotolerans]
MKRNSVVGLGLCLAMLGLAADGGEHELFEPTWESLAKANTSPEWFEDAKLGIYCHWGVYSVPQNFTEWYPRFMFQDGHEVQDFHKQNYGDPAEFPYHKFVPMFTAEKFDAAEWAEVYKSSGARFGGLVAEHHDGFSMWDSRWTPWNAKAMGPKRDVLGELAAELRKRDMKVIATFHHARQFQRNQGAESVQDPADSFDSHYIYDKRYATASAEPVLQKLYGNMPEDEWNQMWLGKLEEVIENYQPDVIYFDSWLNLVPEEFRQRFCAAYYNHAARNNKEVVIVYKQDDLPADVALLDIEKGGRIEIDLKKWMTDDTVSFGSWSYTTDLKIKPAAMVVHSLVDIVSKNGNMLLNISPHPDGSIPQEQKDILRQLGDWLKVYGEAIFDTRPWTVHGFGPTKPDFGPHGGMSTINYYTPEDYRFTMSKDGKAVYVIVLGRPEPGGKLFLWSCAPHRYPLPGAVERVVELSSGRDVEWESLDTGSYLHYPDMDYNETANVFKIILK